MTESQLKEIEQIFAKAKADVEALLKPPPPDPLDFGEPVRAAVVDRDSLRPGDVWVCVDRDGCTQTGKTKTERRAACYNSLAGVRDPESFVRLAKEMAEHMEKSPFRSGGWWADIPERVNWLRECSRLAEEIRKAVG